MDDFENSIYVVNNLTRENLREFSYSRAKHWCKLLNKLTEREDPDDIVNMDEVENMYGAEDEEQADDADSSEYEDKHAEENSAEMDDSALDMSNIEQNLTASNAQNVLAVIAQNPNTTGIVSEYRDFLEKTLPFFENYNRELREDGFEKLLNTFDERKIDRHVSKMLCRRLPNNALPNCTRRYPNADDETDTDSVDEARYVRSKRKALDVHKKYEIKTTTIKSISSIRRRCNELPEKYAYDISHNSMQLLNNRVKKHPAIAASDCHSWAGCRSCHHYARVAHKSHNITKRHNRYYCNSSLSPCSTTDEDELFHPSNHFKNKKHKISCQCSRSCSQSYCGALLFNNRERVHHYYQHELQTDSRSCRYNTLPLVHESQCECRGIDRLCSHARHLANSSTENWLVENYDSAEQAEDATIKTDVNKLKKKNQEYYGNLKTPKIEGKRCLAKNTTKEAASTEYSQSEDEIMQSCNESSKLPDKRSVQKKKEKSTIKKEVQRKKHETNKTRATDADDSFELELQLAIQASKDAYAEELKNRLIKETAQKSTNTKQTKKPMQRKTTKKSVSFQEDFEPASRIQKQRKEKYKTLADISESEFKENERNRQNTNKQSRHAIKTNAKVFSNLEYAENKNTKGGAKIKAPSSPEAKQKPKNTSKVKKMKNPKTQKSSKSKRSQNVSLESNTSSSYTSRLNKLHLSENSSSDSSSTDATQNNTVIKSTSTSTTTNATISENTTFFTHSGQICNSTALTSPIMKSRQISPTTTTNTTVVTTSSQHCDMLPSTSQAARITHLKSQILKSVKEANSPLTDSSDCKQVSSTTELQAEKTLTKHRPKSPNSNCNPIVLYTPHDTTLVPESSFVNDKYRLTLEHLGSIIGEKYAQVFFRYYRGKRDFMLSSTVRYFPPKRGYYSGNDTSDDDIDPFDRPDIGRIVEEK